MLHPSYSDLMKVVNKDVEQGEAPVVNSRYSIVMATSKRARQIISGDEPLVYNSGKKPLSLAVEELNQGKIKILAEDEVMEPQEIYDQDDDFMPEQKPAEQKPAEQKPAEQAEAPGPEPENGQAEEAGEQGDEAGVAGEQTEEAVSDEISDEASDVVSDEASEETAKEQELAGE